MESDKLLAQMRLCAHYLHHRNEGKGSQERILMILNKKERISQRDLLEIVGIRSSSLSEVLTKIENNGYIVRHKKDEDKRNVEIAITPSGKKRALEVRKIHEERSKNLFASLSPQEQIELSSLLEKLLSSWNQDDHHRHHHSSHE
ncbi:MarR family winged helix-turn-helix transcriptional regulator [Beduini massiliensis]|uniref:MarR family winged helix-turn-helix transcriptional regulator n=1 Tax=Beduini massiliensis TaxID=1585974 RepID=UPI00059AA851|nr:MarR family transcriptional regulator [Beduini massiliensis]